MARKAAAKTPKPPKTAAPRATPKTATIGDQLKQKYGPLTTTEKPKVVRPQSQISRTANPSKINMGHTPGSASRAVVPYEPPAPSKLGKVAVAGAKLGARLAAGVAGAYISMIADAKPTGDQYDDKPSGPLMKGNANVPRKPAPSSNYTPKKAVPPKPAPSSNYTPSTPEERGPNRGLGPSKGQQFGSKMQGQIPDAKPTKPSQPMKKAPASGSMSYNPPVKVDKADPVAPRARSANPTKLESRYQRDSGLAMDARKRAR